MLQHSCNQAWFQPGDHQPTHYCNVRTEHVVHQCACGAELPVGQSPPASEQPKLDYLTNPLTPVLREALRVVWAAEMYREGIANGDSDRQVQAHRLLLDMVDRWRNEGFWMWLTAVDVSPETRAAIAQMRR